MAGSLVSSILNRATILDDVRLEESIQKVEKKCTDLREEILQFVKQNYDEFLDHAESTISNEQRVQEVLTEFQRLSSRVDGDLKSRLAKSIGKREEIEKQFNEIELKIKFVEKLVSVHKKLEQAKQDISSECYSTAATKIMEMTSSLNHIGQSGCDAKVFQSLKSELASVEKSLKYQLHEEWNKLIQWKPSMPTSELDSTAALDIQHVIVSNSAQFEDIIKSMKCMFTTGEWEGIVRRYAMKLLDAFVKPLLRTPGLKLVLDENESSNMLSFEKVDDVSVTTSVVDGILTLLNAVHEIMPGSEKREWMALLGKTIEPELTPLVLKHVLSEQIPKTTSDREEFSQISSVMAAFEEKLKNLCIVEEDYSVLTDYTANVDTHVATQQCQDILSQARSLLLQPLHNTTRAGAKDMVLALEKLQISTKSGNVNSSQIEDTQISGSIQDLDISSLTFVFPSCEVSESINQLVTLLYDTLIKSSLSSRNTAIQLYYTARDMIELFIAICTSYHQTSVSQLPRNAAIQHNNYMYVAHHLLTVGHQFHCRIPVNGLTFSDYVPRLRKLGEDCFLAEMDKQSSSILEFLQPFTSFFDISSNAEKQEEFDRAIRQAILHIYNLSKAYSEILPADVFKRCQCGLLNVLVTELISRTLQLVDIAVDDATVLHNIFQLQIIEKSPVALSLTQEQENQLPSLCTNWEKLKELVFVLQASQNDIVTRWGKGEGPLAKQFSVSEVKQLIRALFKNTERRSESLTKII